MKHLRPASTTTTALYAFLSAAVVVACTTSEARSARPDANANARTPTNAENAAGEATTAATASPENATSETSAKASTPASVTRKRRAKPELYAWPHDAGAEALVERFPDPEGFSRVDVEDGSFAAFLRDLPLAPEGTKVVDYQGSPLYSDGHHENIAAVVDIDVGTRDLQQCADAYYRLHAEWQYSARPHGDIRYASLSGVALPYARYLAGERAVLKKGNLALVPSGGPRKDDHAFFRTYLDDVFAWASTGSLERDAKKVAFEDIRGGDAFVLTGSPFGHAVVVLDVAKDTRGRVALLLGQSYMPAQSVHVLRPTRTSTWFLVSPGDATVTTPFWRPFPMTSLRRLP